MSKGCLDKVLLPTDLSSETSKCCLWSATKAREAAHLEFVIFASKQAAHTATSSRSARFLEQEAGPAWTATAYAESGLTVSPQDHSQGQNPMSTQKWNVCGTVLRAKIMLASSCQCADNSFISSYTYKADDYHGSLR